MGPATPCYGMSTTLSGETIHGQITITRFGGWALLLIETTGSLTGTQAAITLLNVSLLSPAKYPRN